MFTNSITKNRRELIRSNGELSGYYAEISSKTNIDTLEKYIELDCVLLGSVDYIVMDYSKENFDYLYQWYEENCAILASYEEIDGLITEKAHDFIRQENPNHKGFRILK